MNGKQLKNSILQWAIQGRLVAQDPNDEPAAHLLERIRGEKARLVREKKIKPTKNETTIYRGDDGNYYERNLNTGATRDISEEIPFTLPQGWEWVRGAQVSVITGTSFPKGDFIYVDVDAIDNKRNVIDRPKSLTKKNAPSRATRKLHVNDVLFSKVRPYLRNVAIITEEYGEAIGSTGFYVITPNDALYTEYLFHMMLSSYVVDGLSIFVKSDHSPSVNDKHITNFLFPLPPLSEQHRIVAKIESLLPVVERYEKAQSALDVLNGSIRERLKKSILQEAIRGRLVEQDPADEPAGRLIERIRGEKARLMREKKIKPSKNETSIFKGEDGNYYERNLSTRAERDITEEIPFELPRGWEWTRLGSIGDWGAGATPAKGNSSYYGGNILWLRTGELNNGIVYDTEIKITDKALKECPLRLNKEGDVLIAMYGATIGKVAIAGCELTTNQACCACTPIEVFNYYLFYFLMGSKADFIKKGEGGAQPNISRDKLITHLLPLPPFSEQHRIVAKIESLFAALDGAVSSV